ncbi:MAG: YkvA family protein [Bacteroidota bacterium]
MKNPFKKYNSQFSEAKFWRKLKNFFRQIGMKTSYAALLLFYAYRRNDTPAWAKNIVIGVLGYLISPIDMLPDLTPIIGYTDDLGILGFGLVTIAGYINMDVKIKARKKVKDWFGELDHDEIAEVEKNL